MGRLGEVTRLHLAQHDACSPSTSYALRSTLSATNRAQYRLEHVGCNAGCDCLVLHSITLAAHSSCSATASAHHMVA